MSSRLTYDRPRFEPPHRVLLLVAANGGWWHASQERREALLPHLARLLEGSEHGARLLASFDDDYFMTGDPTTIPFSMHLIYEIDDPDAIVGMIHEVRSSELGQYMRFEARLGRRLFLVDR